MTGMSIGEGARQFQLSRQNTSLKTDLGRLSAELSSGQKSDKTVATNGLSARLSGIEHSLGLLQSYRDGVRETGQSLNSLQSVLANVDNMRSNLAGDLLLVSPDSPTSQINEAGKTAFADFGRVLSALNTRQGDRNILSGAAFNQPSFSSPDTFLASLASAVSGESTAVGIIAGVENWFNDPNGFALSGYLGDSGEKVSKSLSRNEDIILDFRGDSPEIRDLLKGLALAVLADQLPGIDQSAKAELLQNAGVTLHASASSMTEIRARVGSAEAKMEQALVFHTAEQTMLFEAKNSYVVADPFETATQLQALQIQLETHYAMTARLSRLSLSAYL